MNRKRLPILAAGLVALLAVGGGVAWLAWPEPEPEPDPTDVEDDTGFTRHETEDLMREIGYVQ
ncbi:MAG: hypothetical protein H6742_13240 [Alphaproteobacteria bacterium]|nr:hypothetical protein [Alphaproteobacteria bacterium]